MEMKLRLNIEEGKQTGELGLVPETVDTEIWDSFIPSTFIAHDVLEHVPNESGKIWEEFAALGAYHFTRSDYRPGWHTLQNSYASDIVSTLRDAMYSDNNEHTLRDMPKAPIVRLDDWQTDSLNDAFYGIRPKVRENLVSEVFYDADSEEEKKELNYMLDQISKIKSWFRYGYKQAEKRFSDCDDPNWLFEEVNKMSAKNSHDLHEVHESGGHYMLEISQGCEVKFYAVLPWDSYDEDEDEDYE